MKCPKCGYPSTRVLDSRVVDDWMAIRRRRECEKCGYRFTTFERPAIKELVVIKRDWSRQIYDREKIKRGLLLAFAKRPVGGAQIEQIINELESKWVGEGKEITSSKIGEDILQKLREVDPVAYVRFASVYKKFESLEDFAKILQENEDEEN